MRYIIYGAGAIGGSIGARLSLNGQEVILIARGAHFDAISNEGLRYRHPEMDGRLQIRAVDHPRHIHFQEQDVVFLTMKSQHTYQALVDLAACAPPGIPVVCCQNGVANESMAIRRFRNVYGMVVFLPATHLVAGEVLHFSTTPGGVLDAGRFPTGIDQTITTITHDLSSAGFLADPDERAMRFKYAKLLGNLGNAVQALAASGSETRDIMALLRKEALACFDAAGIDCAGRDETRERNSRVTMSNIEGVQRSGGSSWQSLARGTGDIESDYLNGEICYLGRLYGVLTPANEALCALANEAVRNREKPGALTADDIRQAIESVSAT